MGSIGMDEQCKVHCSGRDKKPGRTPNEYVDICMIDSPIMPNCVRHSQGRSCLPQNQEHIMVKAAGMVMNITVRCRLVTTERSLFLNRMLIVS